MQVCVMQVCVRFNFVAVDNHAFANLSRMTWPTVTFRLAASRSSSCATVSGTTADNFRTSPIGLITLGRAISSDITTWATASGVMLCQDLVRRNQRFFGVACSCAAGNALVSFATTSVNCSTSCCDARAACSVSTMRRVSA